MPAGDSDTVLSRKHTPVKKLTRQRPMWEVGFRCYEEAKMVVGEMTGRSQRDTDMQHKVWGIH